MFKNLHLDYKNNSKNSKQYLITKYQQTKNDLEKKNKESLKSSLNFSEKTDSDKIQSVNQKMIESKEQDNISSEIINKDALFNIDINNKFDEYFNGYIEDDRINKEIRKKVLSFQQLN